MPRRSTRSATDDASQTVQDFPHTEARRKNDPPAGVAPTYEVRQLQTTQCADDPHLDSQLAWVSRSAPSAFQVDVVPLHIPFHAGR